MWILYALLAALAGATLATLTKVGLRSVEPHIALAVQAVLILLISWGATALRGQLGELAHIDRKTWAYLLVAGVVTSASYLLLYRALKLAAVSRVAPLDRLSLVFAVLFGALFLKERVTAQVILGGTLMAGGALLIALAKE